MEWAPGTRRSNTLISFNEARFQFIRFTLDMLLCLKVSLVKLWQGPSICNRGDHVVLKYHFS